MRGEAERIEGKTYGVLTTVPREPGPTIVAEAQLYQNYPNPFNSSSTISFSIARPAHVTVTVYDVLGRAVRTAVNERFTEGNHAVRFTADNLASGVYLVVMDADGSKQIRKMVMIK